MFKSDSYVWWKTSIWKFQFIFLFFLHLPLWFYLFKIEDVLPDCAHLVNGEENQDDDEYGHTNVSYRGTGTGREHVSAIYYHESERCVRNERKAISH